MAKILLGLLLILLLLPGCASQAASLTNLLPEAGAISGWDLAEEARVYNHDNLFDMVDGQADAFFVYGFEQVVTQRYQNPEGTLLEVALWQLATPADAYGLFTSARAGDPTIVCPMAEPAHCYEGDADPGRRLAFWQDHYYVQVYGRQALSDTDLQAFARSVSAALPVGGERPALVNRLPKANLIDEQSFIFFHEEISIQNDIWLGGENILELSPQTDGLLGRYELEGVPVYLLLIQYPEAAAAQAGLTALKTGSVEKLVLVESRDNLLGAVFGEVKPAAVKGLLAEALGKQ